MSRSYLVDQALSFYYSLLAPYTTLFVHLVILRFASLTTVLPYLLLLLLLKRELHS